MPGFYVQSDQEVNGGVMLNVKAVERTTLLSQEQSCLYREEKLCCGSHYFLFFFISYLLFSTCLFVCENVWANMHDMWGDRR